MVPLGCLRGERSRANWYLFLSVCICLCECVLNRPATSRENLGFPTRPCLD